jgi:hypothetical protein
VWPARSATLAAMTPAPTSNPAKMTISRMVRRPPSNAGAIRSHGGQTTL